jgi:hypothetical protein
MGEVPKKIVSVNFSYAVFCIWICWPLNVGLIGCPETSVWNYRSPSRNILKKHGSTWWFGDAGLFVVSALSSSERSGFVLSGSALNVQHSYTCYVYWTVHHLDSRINTDQLDVTCFIISVFTAQHVSNVSTSIFRSLRLIVDFVCCIDVVRCVLVLRCSSALLSASGSIRIPHHPSQTTP